MFKFVVACGNAFDGIGLYGPFDEHLDAEQWAEQHGGDEWTVVTMGDPEKFAKELENY